MAPSRDLSAGRHVSKQGLLRAGLSAAALCAAFAAQAALTPVAPACTAAATNPTWADCAGAFSGNGSFGSNPSESSGTLNFDFAIDLKAGNAFSLSSFHGNGVPISPIDFMTLGMSVNPNGLSQAPIYATATVAAIPEPHTNLLMLAGLAAVGFIATRRRRP